MFTIKIVDETSRVPGKLADAELHFTEGPLAGLRLIGFSIWERRTGNGRNVTFPARSYAVNGERRSFALLRPSDTVPNMEASDRLRVMILDAYSAWEEGSNTPRANTAGPWGPDAPPKRDTAPAAPAYQTTVATGDTLQAIARAAYDSFTAQERAIVAMGIFPAEKMAAAERALTAAGAAGGRGLAVAIMDLQRGRVN